MSLQSRIASAFANQVVRRPGFLVLLVIGLVAASVVLASRLSINTNQLDLISQDLRQVKDVKRVVDMVGGSGHLIIAFRGNDEVALKQVADDMAAALAPDTNPSVRTLTHKLKTEWVRDRAALFMSTEDLIELRRRVTEKLDDVIRRANPFFFEIVETPEVELEVDDIVTKYMAVGKKSITDDHQISFDRKMVLLIVKPMWDTNELEQTGVFRRELQELFLNYSKTNSHGLTLVEDYDKIPNPDPKIVEFGFTGSYITAYDDSYEIKESLAPVSVVAFIGVLVVMLLFFGRRIGSVGLVISGLVFGILIAFGFAKISVGELNMITSILGGILLGTGIDFGIFLIYRLREELTQHESVDEAVRQTIINAGPASFVSAAGTGAAFFSLVFSDFRGFSQFGILAGFGVFIIALCIYTWVPSLFLIIERRWPGRGRSLIGGQTGGAAAKSFVDDGRRIPKPGLILAASALVIAGLSIFATRVSFDYDSRALTVEHQTSIMLQDELADRFHLSADPVAVYTRDEKEALKVFELLSGEDSAERFSAVDQAASLYSFFPPQDQQERNAKILEEWKADIEKIDRSLLPDTIPTGDGGEIDLGDHWDTVMRMLSVTPYGLPDLPDYYRNMFTHLPTAQPENHGYLTFIYPQVDLWNGENLLQFADQVEELTTDDGEVYHSAGLAILMSTLAKIVLHDAKMFVALTFVLLLIILGIDFRSLRTTLIALLPLVLGMGGMMGLMGLTGVNLNFMNIVVFPIILGYGVSQGVYFLHRFREGTSPRATLRSVGAAIACSTLTTLMGWAALTVAAHRGLKTMGFLACMGMSAVLLVSFTAMPAVLQIIDDRRRKNQGDLGGPPAPGSDLDAGKDLKDSARASA